MSRFTSTSEITPKFLTEGDSIKLCAPFHVFGGFTPYQKFLWTYPSGSILGTDSNTCLQTTPFYRKDCSYIGNGYTGKSFSVKATDQFGCEWKDWINVAFLPSGLSEHTGLSKGMIQCTGQTLYVSGVPSNEFISIGIFDLQGKCLDKYPIQQSRELYLGNKQYPSGVYLITVEGSLGTLVKEKLFIGFD